MAFAPNPTAGNDNISGDAEPDIIDGLEGDDIISGGGGDDDLMGGPGNDTLDGQEGNDRLLGGAGDDELRGGPGNDRLLGQDGNDRLLGGLGDDRYEVERVDTIIELANEGNDSVFFRDDTFTGTYTLAANVENLTMIGRFNNLSAVGNALDNRILGNNTGNDTLDGGDGNDYIQGDFAFFAGSNSFSANTGSDVLRGGAGNDVIWGDQGEGKNFSSTQADDMLFGDSGNDILYGQAGADMLDGGTGNDTLYGGAGNDSYVVDSADTLIELASEGIDSVSFRDDTFTGTYTLAANIENLTLISRFQNFSAVGNELDNRILGNNFGNDTLDGGDGDDYIQGDFEFFTASRPFANSAGSDVLRGGAGNDVIWGDLGQGKEFSVTVSSDKLFGDSGDDTLYGQADEDMLDGGTGNDTLYGGAGADTLLGDTGDDFLDSGTGNDVLDAGTGQNRLIFQKGDGQDIVRGVATAGTTGTADRTGIELVTSYAAGSMGTGSAGIASTEVTLTRTGNDLLIDRNDGDDSVTVENYFASSAANLYPIHSIKFSDTVWSNADINSRVAGQPVDVPAPGTTQIGTDGNDVLTGTVAADILLGRAGDDYLKGGAGNDFLNGDAGKDLLEGGAGDDMLIVDSVLDAITERPGEGTDTVQSYINYQLGGNVENLTLIGNIAVSATGNELDNFMTGNSLNNIMLGRTGNDVLYGDGGDDFLNGELGQDQMFGGVGSDTVIVDDAGDYVWEAANEGSDTVQSYISYTLQDNFENLILIGGTGVVANGNALANVIQGNDADNRIDGMGGLDTLMGNGGNDLMKIYTGQERVSGGSGTDTLQFGADLSFLNLAGLAGTNLSGIEAIDMRNGNASTTRFTLDQMLALSTESNTLRIDGDAGDQLQIGTGWQRGTSSTVGYDQYSWTTGSETGVVLVGQNVTVTMGDWMAA